MRGFNSKLTFTTDLNTAESGSELTFNGGEESDKYDGKITLGVKPLNGDFEISKPADTVNIQKFLKDIGIDPKDFVSLYSASSPYGAAAPAFIAGVDSKSGDAAVKSDILSIYSNLEVYFAQNAFYPLEQELNSQNWRSDNMPSISEEVFSNSYDYSPSGCNAEGCQSFTLSAKLSDGSTFAKFGSNN
jgi:hypothetical protein